MDCAALGALETLDVGFDMLLERLEMEFAGSLPLSVNVLISLHSVCCAFEVLESDALELNSDGKKYRLFDIPDSFVLKIQTIFSVKDRVSIGFFDKFKK